MRLPDEARLEEHVIRRTADAGRLAELGRRLAGFHAGAAGGPRIAGGGRFEVVAGNARDNFTGSAAHMGITISRAVFDRLRDLTEQALEHLRPLIESRAARGVPRDTHGDLRLEHVYLFPESPPPDDLVIIDCIEFNERFRHADPVADMAFLVMDLLFHGRADLADAFREAYFQARGDDEGRSLVQFYSAYRAAVRGKVEGIECQEAEVPAAERARRRGSAAAHWLLALSQLEEPNRRPCLVLAGGLPGAGKSTLARGLASFSGFQVVRSDAVRKELAGVGASPAGPGAFEDGLDSPAWTERTYAECLRRTEELLFEGQRVVVDASFREDARRQAFLHLARRWGVPVLGFVCQARPDTVRARLRSGRGTFPTRTGPSTSRRRPAGKNREPPPGPSSARCLPRTTRGRSSTASSPPCASPVWPLTGEPFRTYRGRDRTYLNPLVRDWGRGASSIPASG